MGYDDDYDREVDEVMEGNVATLAERVVGHKIVSAGNEEVETQYYGVQTVFVITLDDGTKVALSDTDDCCAYTELAAFLLNPEKVDNIITGVKTEDGFTRWHVYADAGDVLSLTVGWSPGNFPYYGFGFQIEVLPEIPVEQVEQG